MSRPRVMAVRSPPSPEIKVRSLVSAVGVALLLVFIDALWLNQGVIAFFVGLVLLLVHLPRALLPKFAPVRAKRLRNLGIYLSAVVLVFVLNALNNRLAQSRAEVLISAVKAFHSKNQRYPKSLQELVPGFIEKVPVAKYTLALNQFSYTTSESGSFLYYTDFPPFGRVTYSFFTKEWGYLD